MTLVSIAPGKVCVRLAEAVAIFAATVLVAGCGSLYRPVITPINPNGPAAQPQALVVAISEPSASVPGIASIIDYAGDDIMAQQPVGVAPLGLTVAESGGMAYTMNRDGTLTGFPVSTTLQELNMQTSTLFNTTKVTNLYSPSTGLWASDLDGNAIDAMSGSPATFNIAIPVAPTPVEAIGPSLVSSRIFAISQNNENTPSGSILPFGTACNIAPREVTQTGEADSIEVTNDTIDARIPLGKCPVFAISSSEGNRLFVINRGDDTITVINSQTAALDSCTCPPTGCVNQNNQHYFCHPSLPLSLSAGLSQDSNGDVPTIAGPVYGEYNATTRQLVVSDYDGGTITIIDVSLDEYGNDSPTFGTTFTIPVGANPASVTVLADGSRAYTANQTDGTVTIANLSSHSVEKMIPVNGHPRTVVSAQNSLYGKVYVASPDSPLLTIIRTDLDITDTTVLVPGNVMDVRVSSQTAGNVNTNNVSRVPGGGQPCNLPPNLMEANYGSNYTLTQCQAMPTVP